VQEVADTVRQALQMPLEERRRRWAAMMKAVTREDVTAWRQSFVTALLAASRAR
jgi:trehalose 6-phosphate synthase